tara:strand:- start:591 stop:3044 length:2454 start_codon:yes stop_codon:yes gene_type:complete
MKPTEVQNLREAYMNEVWGDAFNSRQKEKGLPKPGGPQPKAKRSAAGDEGTLGDALGARLTATPPKRSKKDDKPKEDKPKTDTRTRWQKRRDARRSSSSSARANTNDQGQSIKTDKPVAKKDKENVAPRTAPKSAPSGASDPRNAEYIKKRAAANAAKGDDKKKATKDAESAGMAAWRKANPKLAAAKDKRDKTRGTEKSSNPLMKKYLKDRESRKAGNEKARRDAKADSIAQSPNADKINKKETAIKDNIKSTMKKQALSDRAKEKAGQDPSKPTPKDQLPKGAQQARTGVPKADAPKAAAPKKDTNAGPGGYQTSAAATPKSTSAAKASGTPPASSKAVTPPPSAKPSQPGAPIVATAKQFSKGGKYRRESLMSFGAYQLSEKKTSVKINPKLKDLEEDCLNEGSCSGHSEGGEIVNGRCSICGGTPKKSTKKEETAYVSQEEVSEESYQEGYETETDLTEALPGSIEAKKGSTYDSKADFKAAFKANPGAFKSALPSMGGQKSGMMAYGKPGNYGSNRPTKPIPAFQQKMMYKSGIGMAGGSGKGFWKATMKANNASIAKADDNKPKPSQDMNLNRAGGPSSSSGGSNKPMNANRPSSAPKTNSSGLSGKKPSDLLSKGGKVKKTVSEMTQQEIHEEYVQIQEFLGKIFKGVGNFVKGIFGGGQKQQQQQQPKQQSMKDYNPAKGVKLSGSMNDNRPKISNSSGSNQPFGDSGKPSGSKPSDIADIKSGTPEKVDKGLPNRKDKKKDKRFDEEVECTSEYIGPEERTKMKNDIILAKRAMRASNAAKQKAMSDNERILKSLGKFGKTTPEECDK